MNFVRALRMFWCLPCGLKDKEGSPGPFNILFEKWVMLISLYRKSFSMIFWCHCILVPITMNRRWGISKFPTSTGPVLEYEAFTRFQLRTMGYPVSELEKIWSDQQESLGSLSVGCVNLHCLLEMKADGHLVKIRNRGGPIRRLRDDSSRIRNGFD